MADKSNRKILAVLLTVIVLIVAVAFVNHVKKVTPNNNGEPQYTIANAKHLNIDGVVLDKARVISQFAFSADDNKPFTKNSLRGHWTLMFFGFTNCGYVCPTTLSALNNMYRQLQGQIPPQLLPQVVMVSVDPDRDSIERMHDYVRRFNPLFIGVRGSLQQTSILAQQMSVVFSKMATHSDNYMVNHSAEIMLLDPNGDLRAFFSYPHQAKQMAHDYKTIIQAVK